MPASVSTRTTSLPIDPPVSPPCPCRSGPKSRIDRMFVIFTDGTVASGRVGHNSIVFDLVIRNGTVVDGSGGTGVHADVGIRGGLIEAIGDLAAADAARSIDASGLAVAPGFVDTHTHSEGPLLTDPQHAYGIRQGITTEVVALDGVSYAPLSRPNYLLYRRYLAGLLGEPPLDVDTSTVASFRAAFHRRVAVNVAYLVPHGALRLQALGFHDQPLTGEPLAHGSRLPREG